MAENTTTPAQSERTNYRLSIAIGVACFLWMLNFLALTPFFPFVAKDLNTSVALLGQVSGLVAFGSIPVGMITGPLSDRYGHRKVLLAGMSTLGAGFARYRHSSELRSPNADGALRSGKPSHHQALGGGHSRDALGRRQPQGSRGTGNHRNVRRHLRRHTDVDHHRVLWRMARVFRNFLTALNVLATVYLAWSIPPDTPTSADAPRSRLGLSTYASLVADFPTMLLIGSSLVRSISLWGFNTYRGAFFVDRFGVTTQEVGWIFTIAGMGLFLGGAVASSRFSRLPLYWLAIVGTAAIASGGGLALVLPLGILPAIALTTLTSFCLGFRLGGHGYPDSEPGCRAAGDGDFVEPGLHQRRGCCRKFGRGLDDCCGRLPASRDDGAGIRRRGPAPALAVQVLGARRFRAGVLNSSR